MDGRFNKTQDCNTRLLLLLFFSVSNQESCLPHDLNCVFITVTMTTNVLYFNPHCDLLNLTKLWYCSTLTVYYCYYDDTGLSVSLWVLLLTNSLCGGLGWRTLHQVVQKHESVWLLFPPLTDTGALTGYNCPRCWTSPQTQSRRHQRWGHIWFQFMDDYYYGFRVQRKKEKTLSNTIMEIKPSNYSQQWWANFVIPPRCIQKVHK